MSKVSIAELTTWKDAATVEDVNAAWEAAATHRPDEGDGMKRLLFVDGWAAHAGMMRVLGESPVEYIRPETKHHTLEVTIERGADRIVSVALNDLLNAMEWAGFTHRELNNTRLRNAATALLTHGATLKPTRRAGK